VLRHQAAVRLAHGGDWACARVKQPAWLLVSFTHLLTARRKRVHSVACRVSQLAVSCLAVFLCSYHDCGHDYRHYQLAMHVVCTHTCVALSRCAPHPHCQDTATTCRERCGGGGYLSVNRFGSLLGFAHAGMTAEGDNRCAWRQRGGGACCSALA
jgi:hypothetical protein